MRWLFAVLTISSLWAQSHAPDSGWVSLFNGRDLSGWEPVGKESWEVHGGSIHGRTLTKEYGYLQTTNKYKSFQLTLRFRCNGDGNSGVFFHTAFHPGTVDVSQGLQFEIDPDINKHTAGIYGDGREWVVWPAPEKEGAIHPHDWNDYWMSVEGNRYRARLNGVDMIDFTDPKPLSSDGTIALQMHMGGGGDIEFKDIFIRDLSSR